MGQDYALADEASAAALERAFTDCAGAIHPNPAYILINERKGDEAAVARQLITAEQWTPLSEEHRLLAKKVEILGGVRNSARKPFVAIMGGSKVSDKVAIIEALSERVDELLIGGGMAFTFFAAQGHPVGNSLLEESMVDYCAELLASDRPIRLPHDITALGPGGKLFEPEAGGDVRQMGTSIPDGWMGVDIGPGTASEYMDIIHDAATILWNGPVGVFEDPRFEAGTKTLAMAVAESRGFSVVGGGDSAAAAKQFGVDGDMDHVSTGGGASLELLEKGDLPGLAALRGEFSEGSQ